MHGCCQNVVQASDEKIIHVDKFTYCVIIRYCSNCGQLKSQSHIKEVKNGN
jgi:hypothetical protein